MGSLGGLARLWVIGYHFRELAGGNGEEFRGGSLPMGKRVRVGSSRKTVSPWSIVRHFEALADPRHERNRLHLLGEVIAPAVCGVIVGCEGPTAIARWAQCKEEWLRILLELPNGLPSRDCIRRVLSALKPDAFRQCFELWIASLLGETTTGQPLIAIDGKSMRRSHDHNNGLGPLHLVSAWATELGLSLGQVATEEKSNEITAMPELLDQIDVKGAIVTIDAMGCQKNIATKIIDGGGNYVLAVKDNQPKLHGAIREVFSDQRQAELIDSPHRQHETTDNGHGRKDERYYVLTKIPKGFREKDSWHGGPRDRESRRYDERRCALGIAQK